MDHQLTDRRFGILKSAATRGHGYAGTAEDWQAGLDRLVKAGRREGETPEGAFARLTATGEGAAFLDCLRKAEDTETAQRRGRPRQCQPGEIIRSNIEKALTAGALDLAKAENVSFETAFARVLDTPGGRELYARLRAAAPNVGE